MEELKRAVENRNKAEEECWKAIQEDAKIAEGMRDVWASQQSGAE